MKFKLVKLFTYNKGFTLIEVLLSIVIFSILTLGMLALFSQAMTYTQKSENDTLGVYAARNMLNFMEQQSFNTIKKDYVDALTDEGEGSTVMITNEVCPIWFNGDSDEIKKKRERCYITFSPNLNNRQLNVSVELKKHTDSTLQTSLIPMKILVEWDEGNESSLEGFITNEKLR
ncbi:MULTISPECIES: type IV pilus modification PilV family protein [Bacillaceae]|uniref:type IV pilus modification PilV family protein n=1 Tax=Bacillaceae TaxID=186817 RepID=UPI00159B9577|nr:MULTISPECIES: prepilin-type N-terminal cleavage/methylation domain-containing protein [Bacillaceae]UGB29692.1 prepilin-type N-terminal cleavage/methylation domain-containing protein [Metabacillus sp. B2-18]